MVFLNGSEYVQGFFYRLFNYVLPLEILLSREEGWDPLTGLFPLKVCLCSKLGPGYSTSNVMVSLCSMSSVKITGDSSFC